MRRAEKRVSRLFHLFHNPQQHHRAHEGHEELPDQSISGEANEGERQTTHEYAQKVNPFNNRGKLILCFTDDPIDFYEI